MQGQQYSSCGRPGQFSVLDQFEEVLPQWLKPRTFFAVCGTIKVVPFQNHVELRDHQNYRLRAIIAYAVNNSFTLRQARQTII